jgi:hypothetical protein
MHGFRFLMLSSCLALLAGCGTPPSEVPEPPESGVVKRSPSIDAVSVTPGIVLRGQEVVLSVTARAANAEDTLRYQWSAPSGQFEDATQARTRWTAPMELGRVSFSLTVTDSYGMSATSDLIWVTVSDGTSPADVEVRFNDAPRLTALTSSQSSLDVGQSTALAVAATDEEGDALTYAWSATCAGRFDDARSATPRFTPAARPPEACNNCRVQVTVSDGVGQARGVLGLCVTAPASVQVPPRIVHTWQSPEPVWSYQHVVFEVVAQAPGDAALAFEWSSGTGAGSSGVSDAPTHSRYEWNAPDCAPADAPPEVRVTVTQVGNPASARHVFPIRGLRACE